MGHSATLRAIRMCLRPTVDNRNNTTRPLVSLGCASGTNFTSGIIPILVKVVVSNTDKEWITSELKVLFSKRQRAHKEGNFVLRNCLAKEIKYKTKEAMVNYNAKKANLFSKANSKDW